MRVLAIDPGSSCGFAIGRLGDAPVSGVWQLQPARGESPGMRYVRLRAHLNKMIEAYPDLGLIAFEGAHHRGGAATEYAIGCATLIQTWCADHNVQHATVHSATLKKWATGGGKANKDDMLRAGRQRFKPTTDTDDEIDALWLHDYALAMWGQP